MEDVSDAHPHDAANTAAISSSSGTSEANTGLNEDSASSMHDGADSSDQPQPTPKPSSTSYSFAASALRQRHVPLREPLIPSSALGRRSSSSSSSQTKPQATPTQPERQSGADANTKPNHVEASGSATSAAASSSEPPPDEAGLFECNICLDMASDPVVTLCGHLFCWPCIHRWMVSRLPASNTCPVCKAGIDRDKVIPIYVRGREPKDPRSASASRSPTNEGTDGAAEDVPNRPPGQRPEPTPNGNAWNQFFTQGGGNFGNFHIGVGMFPFGLQFTFGPNGVGGLGGFGGMNNAAPNADQPNIQRMEQIAQIQAFVSRVFLMIATLIIVSIILY